MRRFKRTFKGVEVGILEEDDGVFIWEYTNFGSVKDRVRAINYFNKQYSFMNWKE